MADGVTRKHFHIPDKEKISFIIEAKKSTKHTVKCFRDFLDESNEDACSIQIHGQSEIRITAMQPST
jgi:hypothetical protein